MNHKTNQVRWAILATILPLTLAIPTHAADVSLNWSAPVEVTNSSTKALRVTAATAMEGNKDPELQFAMLADGLPPGTYDVTVDVLYVDKPDQHRSAMRGSNGDGNSFDRQFSIAGALETWFRVTGTATISGEDNWTGTFELKPTIFGNPPNDPPDAFEILYDNIDMTDSTGMSVLQAGGYNFESDTVGSDPANITFFPGTRADALEYGVVSLLSDESFVATISVDSPPTQATITWDSVAGETYDLFRSADLDFSDQPLAADIPAALGEQVIDGMVTGFPAFGGMTFTDAEVDFSTLLTIDADYAFIPSNGDSVGGTPVKVVSWTGNTVTLAAPVGDDLTWDGAYTVWLGSGTNSFSDTSLPPGGRAFYRVLRK